MIRAVSEPGPPSIGAGAADKFVAAAEAPDRVIAVFTAPGGQVSGGTIRQTGRRDEQLPSTGLRVRKLAMEAPFRPPVSRTDFWCLVFDGALNCSLTAQERRSARPPIGVAGEHRIVRRRGAGCVLPHCEDLFLAKEATGGFRAVTKSLFFICSDLRRITPKVHRIATPKGCRFTLELYQLRTR